MVAWPLLLANLIGKIIPFVQKNAASRLPNPGNVSLLEYAFFLSGTVLIFIASPVTTAIFPLMGEQKARGDEKELIKTFHQAIKVVTFLALPCAIFFAVESKDIVAILLQNGKFSPEDTVICANLITIIAIMIVPQSINLIMNNMFMVYKETKKLAISGSLMALLSIPLYFLFANKYGINGIAIVYTVIYSLSTVIYIILLKIDHKSIIEVSVVTIFAKFAVSGVIMATILYYLNEPLQELWLLYRLAIIFTLSFSAYLLMSRLLKIKGMDFILSRIKRIN
jgi:putative peptidoglycan lipid II flippase